MSDLLWWSGITLDTPVRDIGWTYVLLAVCVYALGYLTARLSDAWGHENGMDAPGRTLTPAETRQVSAALNREPRVIPELRALIENYCGRDSCWLEPGHEGECRPGGCGEEDQAAHPQEGTAGGSHRSTRGAR